MNGTEVNGSWRTWLLGIIAGLVLLGIAGTIVINRDTASLLGKQETEISNLKDRVLRVEIEIKRISDLAAERGVALPNLREDLKRVNDEQQRLRDRLDRLEQFIRDRK